MKTEIVDYQTENQPSPAQPETSNSQLQTSSTPPATRAFHRRRPRGRVARLPLRTRNLVNQALRDGAKYADVIALLAAHGFNDFKPDDIVAWNKRGYPDWLREQERFEQSRAPSDRALALLGALREDGRSDLGDLNESLLCDQLNELLEAADSSQLKQLLSDKPEDYFRLARAVTALTLARAHRQQVELERLKYELQMRRIQERQARHAKPRQITQEIRDKIDAAARLF